ncbi:MAG: hypothetical protein MH208_20135, partial [Marinobacter sp.]|nr:hypothetical protein [Marinobacter sp.]
GTQADAEDRAICSYTIAFARTAPGAVLAKAESSLNLSVGADIAASAWVFNLILQGFAAFAYRTGGLSLKQDASAEQLIVVFGTDHGLCGNYNESLAQLVKQHQNAQSAGQAAPAVHWCANAGCPHRSGLETGGYVTTARLRRRHWPLGRRYCHPH